MIWAHRGGRLHDGGRGSGAQSLDNAIHPGVSGQVMNDVSAVLLLAEAVWEAALNDGSLPGQLLRQRGGGGCAMKAELAAKGRGVQGRTPTVEL